MLRSILRSARQVMGEGGIVETYDKLIIATGSLPFIPPIEGITLPDGRYKPGVFVVSHSGRLPTASPTTPRARRARAVIGGGLLGLEAARGLQNFALDVHVIQRGDHLMGQQLDAPAAGILKRTLEQLGIKVHARQGHQAISGDDRVTGLASRTARRSTAIWS